MASRLALPNLDTMILLLKDSYEHEQQKKFLSNSQQIKEITKPLNEEEHLDVLRDHARIIPPRIKENPSNQRPQIKSQDDSISTIKSSGKSVCHEHPNNQFELFHKIDCREETLPKWVIVAKGKHKENKCRAPTIKISTQPTCINQKQNKPITQYIFNPHPVLPKIGKQGNISLVNHRSTKCAQNHNVDKRLNIQNNKYSYHFAPSISPKPVIITHDCEVQASLSDEKNDIDVPWQIIELENGVTFTKKVMEGGDSDIVPDKLQHGSILHISELSPPHSLRFKYKDNPVIQGGLIVDKTEEEPVITSDIYTVREKEQNRCVMFTHNTKRTDSTKVPPFTHSAQGKPVICNDPYFYKAVVSQQSNGPFSFQSPSSKKTPISVNQYRLSEVERAQINKQVISKMYSRDPKRTENVTTFGNDFAVRGGLCENRSQHYKGQASSEKAPMTIDQGDDGDADAESYSCYSNVTTSGRCPVSSPRCNLGHQGLEEPLSSEDTMSSLTITSEADNLDDYSVSPTLTESEILSEKSFAEICTLTQDFSGIHNENGDVIKARKPDIMNAAINTKTNDDNSICRKGLHYNYTMNDDELIGFEKKSSSLTSLENRFLTPCPPANSPVPISLMTHRKTTNSVSLTSFQRKVICKRICSVGTQTYNIRHRNELKASRPSDKHLNRTNISVVTLGAVANPINEPQSYETDSNTFINESMQPDIVMQPGTRVKYKQAIKQVDFNELTNFRECVRPPVSYRYSTPCRVHRSRRPPFLRNNKYINERFGAERMDDYIDGSDLSVGDDGEELSHVEDTDSLVNFSTTALDDNNETSEFANQSADSSVIGANDLTVDDSSTKLHCENNENSEVIQSWDTLAPSELETVPIKDLAINDFHTQQQTSKDRASIVKKSHIFSRSFATLSPIPEYPTCHVSLDVDSIEKIPKSIDDVELLTSKVQPNCLDNARIDGDIALQMQVPLPISSFHRDEDHLHCLTQYEQPLKIHDSTKTEYKSLVYFKKPKITLCLQPKTIVPFSEIERDEGSNAYSTTSFRPGKRYPPRSMKRNSGKEGLWHPNESTHELQMIRAHAQTVAMAKHANEQVPKPNDFQSSSEASFEYHVYDLVRRQCLPVTAIDDVLAE